MSRYLGKFELPK